ncbi:DUF937 domain-containing protein [Streptomyces sp. NPDC012794]|uniref:DUF937 domain-containing protein n=1 Tax=Streptomyces sp. NPDC012794 TaxID=3364850 RepID=UPI00367AC3A4
MSESSFQDDVMRELGDDRLGEIAGLLGTDTDGARETVAQTVGAMTGGLQEKADAGDDEVRQALAEASGPPGGSGASEAPLQGVATLGGGLGGLLGGGMMAGVLAKVGKPVADAVAKRTGIPAPTVMRVVEMLIPVVMAVFAKRMAAGKGPGGTAGGAGAGGARGGGLGDLLGQILGGGRK